MNTEQYECNLSTGELMRISSFAWFSFQTITATYLMHCLLFLRSRTPGQSWAPLTSQLAASATQPSATLLLATAPPSAWTPLPTAPKGPSATAPHPPLPPPGTVTARWAAAQLLSLPRTVTPWPQTGTLGRFGWSWSLRGNWNAERKMTEMMEQRTQGQGKEDTAVDRLQMKIQSLSWAQKEGSGRNRDQEHMWTGWCRKYWTQREPTYRTYVAL